ncbi:peptidase domain-containing ABC transporter [Flavobacteriaceae bacterium GF1]
MSSFKLYKQHDKMDCGPTCLKMIASFYGKEIALSRLRELCYLNREGVSIMGISHAAESIGFSSIGTRVDLSTLMNKVPLPCIVHWRYSHFVVVYKTSKTHVFIADPEEGKKKMHAKEFKREWCSDEKSGLVLLLEPTPAFYENQEDNRATFTYFLKYFLPHKNLIIQIFMAIIFSSITSLLTPFFTQSIVDIGILGNNLKFIYIVLLAQFMLTMGNVFISFMQSWVSLHLSLRVSLSFIIGYLSKLLQMPFTFFEQKTVGDITQRITDNSRIERFLNDSIFSLLVSLFNFIMYSGILAFYNIKLLFVFFIGNTIYVVWVLLFLKKRREFDNENFKITAQSENKILQLFFGAREIILNNIEKEKRWEWEYVKSKEYYLEKKILYWEELQVSGGTLINTLSGLLISLFVALEVINGNMTLGMMLAVQFIMGQIQVPLSSFIGIVHSYQDARISLERLTEVFNYTHDKNAVLTDVDENSDITMKNVTFQYGGPNSPKILDNINLTIPSNKITAIVGSSGSGKTTILKLLLKLYQPIEGDILIGKKKLKYIQDSFWRDNCGVVMQDNYIFDDTILNNIILKNLNSIDYERLEYSVDIANIKDWIDSLPLGYSTKIGLEGVGLSEGQKQRLLIARAIYKNSKYIFLDEATNSLDAKNEKIIIEKLSKAIKNKTVVIIAHRLSTIKSSDQIILLHKGKIVESGNHDELIKNKGHYYQLVNSQL